MATIRSASGSILGSVSSVASIATTIVGTAEKSVMLLSNRVDDALKQQTIRLAAEGVDNAKRISDEVSMDIARRRSDILKELAGDKVLAKQMEEAQAEVDAAIAKALGNATA